MPKKNNRNQKEQNFKREMEYKDSDEAYAIIEAIYGNGKAQVLCDDGESRLARMAGKFKKGKSKIRFEKGDIILTSLRDFQGSKCDIIYKYTSDEIRILRKGGHISFDKNEVAEKKEDELPFDFDSI